MTTWTNEVSEPVRQQSVWDPDECAFRTADGRWWRWLDPGPGARWLDDAGETVLVARWLDPDED